MRILPTLMLCAMVIAGTCDAIAAETVSCSGVKLTSPKSAKVRDGSSRIENTSSGPKALTSALGFPGTSIAFTTASYSSWIAMSLPEEKW